jgi:hypothetical protein
MTAGLIDSMENKKKCEPKPHGSPEPAAGDLHELAVA